MVKNEMAFPQSCEGAMYVVNHNLVMLDDDVLGFHLDDDFL